MFVRHTRGALGAQVLVDNLRRIHEGHATIWGLVVSGRAYRCMGSVPSAEAIPRMLHLAIWMRAATGGGIWRIHHRRNRGL